MDMYSRVKRSQIMSSVRQEDTKPELIARDFIHKLGFRFRCHDDKLPGCPDILLPDIRKAIFVHGCFWHGHKNCARSKRPASNMGFWNKKIDKNIKRDSRKIRALRKLGWRPAVLWSCEIRYTLPFLIRIQQILYT